MVKAAALLLALLAAAAAQEHPATPGGETPASAVPASAAEKSRVYFARNPSAVQGGNVRSGAVRRMVDAVVMAAAGRGNIDDAWRVFISPGERVGLKISASGGAVSGTHPAVIEAVAAGLAAAGAREIVVWDRAWRDIERGGYDKLAGGVVRVTATDRAGGYDGKQMVTAAVMGQLIVGDRDFETKMRRGETVSSTSYVSNVLSREVDKVVLLPALTDHAFSGLNGAISGMVLDNLDNWRRLARAPHYGDPYLPEIYADPRLGGKVVLIILDALRPQYAGGPYPGAQFTVNYGAIFASRDPVALDATGLRLLDGFRENAGMPLLAKRAAWLDTAAYLGLGAVREEDIELQRAEVESEVRWVAP